MVKPCRCSTPTRASPLSGLVVEILVCNPAIGRGMDVSQTLWELGCGPIHLTFEPSASIR